MREPDLDRFNSSRAGVTDQRKSRQVLGPSIVVFTLRVKTTIGSAFSRRLLLDPVCGRLTAPPLDEHFPFVRNHDPRGCSGSDEREVFVQRKRCWNSLPRAERQGQRSDDATSSLLKEQAKRART